jgi:hypothetical protein
MSSPPALFLHFFLSVPPPFLLFDRAAGAFFRPDRVLSRPARADAVKAGRSSAATPPGLRVAVIGAQPTAKARGQDVGPWRCPAPTIPSGFPCTANRAIVAAWIASAHRRSRHLNSCAAVYRGARWCARGVCTARRWPSCRLSSGRRPTRRAICFADLIGRTACSRQRRTAALVRTGSRTSFCLRGRCPAR